LKFWRRGRAKKNENFPVAAALTEAQMLDFLILRTSRNSFQDFCNVVFLIKTFSFIISPFFVPKFQPPPPSHYLTSAQESNIKNLIEHAFLSAVPRISKFITKNYV
jgi:hypothetical protein